MSTRVGRAQTWVYRWTAEQYAKSLGTRDFIWSNEPGSAQGGSAKLWFPPGSFSGFYIAVSRVPSQSRNYGPVTAISACGRPKDGCPLSWFQANHPNWIILKHDQATPAYQFNDRTWIPLDIGNPDVQTWIEANFILPALAAGYQGISIDNVSDRNDFDEKGVCSVAIVTGNCASNGGTWKQLYSGVRVHDATFLANRLTWLKRLTSLAHAHDASTMANVTYDPRDTAGTARLIEAVDIWYDEAGFNGASMPTPCEPGGGAKYKVFDANWTQKIAFINSLNGGASWPMVQQATMCPLTSPSRRVVEYAMASYYMTKRSHTYIAPYFGNPAAFEDQSPGGMWPDFTYQHGAATDAAPVVTGGVFKRAFANLLVLMNPSSTIGVTYELSGVYHDFDGTRYVGKIALPPLTGLTLLPAEARR